MFRLYLCKKTRAAAALLILWRGLSYMTFVYSLKSSNIAQLREDTEQYIIKDGLAGVKFHFESTARISHSFLFVGYMNIIRKNFLARI